MIIITNDGLQYRDKDVFSLTWLKDWKQRETAAVKVKIVYFAAVWSAGADFVVYTVYL